MEFRSFVAGPRDCRPSAHPVSVSDTNPSLVTSFPSAGSARHGAAASAAAGRCSFRVSDSIRPSRMRTTRLAQAAMSFS